MAVKTQKNICKYKSSILSQIILVIIGAIITYIFTIYGYNLSFPDYPDLIVDYQTWENIYFVSPNNSSIQPSTDNFFFIDNISFSLINKGRPDIETLFVAILGDSFYSNLTMIHNLKGKNGYVDIDIPLRFRCKTNSSDCNIENIIGKKVVNIYISCLECGVKIKNYPIELCIFDGINLTLSECNDRLYSLYK